MCGTFPSTRRGGLERGRYRLVADRRDPLVRVRRMGRSLRIALLSYRSKPHSGGQGIYVRALSRELAELGHRVEVLSGQPYPELDTGVPLTRLPSLDLYREPDPFRTPRPSEFRDWVDVAEWATMCTAGFPEPLTFSLRAARHLLPRAAEFDVVHDNQSLGWGLLQLVRAGLPTVATVHHPVAIDRQLELAAAQTLRRKLTLRRWYAFTGMQARVVRRLDGVTTVSENSRADIATHMGLSPAGVEFIPVGIDPAEFTPPTAGQARDTDSILVITSADVALKGLVHLLEALAKLRTERPVRLTVVGSARPGGPAEAALDRPGARGGARRAAAARRGRRHPVAVRGFLPPRRRGDGVRDPAGDHRRRRAAGGGRLQGRPPGEGRRRR